MWWFTAGSGLAPSIWTAAATKASANSKMVKVAHTRLPTVGFRSWSRFLAVSLQVTWVINPAVGCHYFPPGLQLPPQPLRGLLPILLLDEQRHNGCEQFSQDCYTTASRLRFEPGPFCAWVQHANHSATEPPHISISQVFCRRSRKLAENAAEFRNFVGRSIHRVTVT